jgi:hypothetical protein
MTAPKNKWFADNIPEDVANIVVRIHVKVPGGGTISRDFRTDVEIDYDNLEEQLARTPSAFSYWAGVMSEQKMVVGVFERKIKRRRAIVAEQILNTAKAEGISLRAADIKELIEADDILEKLEAELLIAQRSSGKLYNIVEAIKMKSEHLRSLAGFKRQELRDAGSV